MTDLATIQRAAAQCEGDIIAARAALTRAADMLSAMRRQIDVMTARESAAMRGAAGQVAAGVEASMGDFAGGLA